MVSTDSSSWGRALVQISPYSFAAIGIAISIGVSVLGAAWYFHFFVVVLGINLGFQTWFESDLCFICYLYTIQMKLC